MKKARLSLLGLAIASMVLVGCSSDGPIKPEEQSQNGSSVTGEGADFQVPSTASDKITEIKLNKQAFSLFYSEKESNSFKEDTTLVATVYPKKAGKRNIKWSSSDNTVATVDENGKVSAVGEGTAEITVSNEDGTVKDSAHVVVNNMTDVRLANAKTRLTDILNKQKSSDFVVPETISEYETFSNVTTKNGKVVTTNKFSQCVTASEKNAYLDLYVDSQETRVENGSPVPEKTHYTFYTTDQFETFLFKSSGKVKNYMSINQSNFMGQSKVEALKSVCDQFFISGAGILTGAKEDIMPNNLDTAIQSTSYNEHFGRFESVKGQVAFDLRESGQDTADQKDQENNYIPVGTKYRIDFYCRFLFENNLLTAKRIEQSYTYTVGSDNFVSKFEIDYWYKTNEEIVYPQKENYQLVDSAFDL